jgi:hypothetical protein
VLVVFVVLCVFLLIFNLQEHKKVLDQHTNLAAAPSANCVVLCVPLLIITLQEKKKVLYKHTSSAATWSAPPPQIVFMSCGAVLPRAFFLILQEKKKVLDKHTNLAVSSSAKHVLCCRCCFCLLSLAGEEEGAGQAHQLCRYMVRPPPPIVVKSCGAVLPPAVLLKLQEKKKALDKHTNLATSLQPKCPHTF